jgi:hypothetical protein
MMQNSYFVFVVVLLSSLGFAIASLDICLCEQPILRAATFNVYNTTDADFLLERLSQTSERLLAFYKKENLDVMCLQELWYQVGQ